MLKGPPVKGAHHWNKNTLDMRQIKITALRAQLLVFCLRAHKDLATALSQPESHTNNLHFKKNLVKIALPYQKLLNFDRKKSKFLTVRFFTAMPKPYNLIGFLSKVSNLAQIREMARNRNQSV
jgi:hypothetical protein